MRKHVIAACALSATMAVSLAACVPAAEQGAQGESQSGATAEQAFSDKNDSVTEVTEDLEERAETYKPIVRTLEDGTQVQLTPDLTSSYQYWWAPNSYNTYYLDADNRGCVSCHQEGLGKLVDEELSWRHLPITNGLGTEIDARDCRMCHNEFIGDKYGDFLYGSERSFGNLIHSIHRGDDFKGDCMSCHTATADGNGMRLWEDAKYDVLGGIIDVPDVQGDFSYEQDIALGDNLALANWGNSFDEPWDKAFTDEEIPEDKRNNWEISISGMVDEPFSITLGELIEEAPSETFYAKLHCNINNPSGEMLANVEAKAIPLSWLLEKAGVQDGATSLASNAAIDGSHRIMTLDHVKSEGGWLLYEINGKPLTWKDGGPVRTFYPTAAADSDCKFVDEIVIGDEEPNNAEGFAVPGTPHSEDAWRGTREGGDEVYANKPNVGICNIHEGQIISANETFEFEGYADAFEEQVVAVEFSMDQGETWTRFDTSDSDKSKLVYWHFGFTPEEAGAYVLQVRAITESGIVSTYPDEIMVNAK